MAMMNPKLMFTFMLLVLLISLEVCAVPDHGGGASEPMRRLEVMPSSPLPILGGAFYEPIPISAAGREVSGPYPSGGDIGGKASVQHRVPSRDISQADDDHVSAAGGEDSGPAGSFPGGKASVQHRVPSRDISQADDDHVSAAGGEVSGPYPSGGDIGEGNETRGPLQPREAELPVGTFPGGKASVQHRVPSRDISQADDDHVSAAGGEVSGPYPSGGDIGEGSETRGPLQSREAELPEVSFPGGKASVQHRVPSRDISQADDDHDNYLAEGELAASDPSDQFDRSWLKCKQRCIYKLKACMVHSCCSSLLGGHRHKQYCHKKSCQKKRKKCLKLMQ